MSKSIVYLDLSYNKIESLSETNFYLLTRLSQLYLNMNQLKTLPLDTFVRMSKEINVLDLSNNQLDSLNGTGIELSKGLSYLFLRGNKLKHLPTNLFALIDSSLRTFDVSFNQLTKWDRINIDRASNLNLLKINNNQLRSLENIRFYNKSINYLYFSFNMLSVEEQCNFHLKFEPKKMKSSLRPYFESSLLIDEQIELVLGCKFMLHFLKRKILFNNHKEYLLIECIQILKNLNLNKKQIDPCVFKI